MAYTKIKAIKKRLDVCVKYVLNEEKTDLSNALAYIMNADKDAIGQTLYESAINCYKRTAYQDMMQTKKAFNKEDGIQGYHIMQSFKPEETTLEQAHDIGKAFAQTCFGDKYEVVVATHLDRHHLHNHIIINSVSFVDGKKYYNTFDDYFKDIRGTSDRICKEHGLSIIEPTEANKSLSYIDWLSQNKGKTSWHSLIRLDIDDAIKQAFNYGNFIMLMQNKGYTIKQGKYLALRPYGKERFSRTYKLGDVYTEQAIKSRILGKDLAKELPQIKRYLSNKKIAHPKGKLKGFQALCFHYLYLLGAIKTNKAPEKVSLLLKEDLLKFEDMTRTFNFLKDRNLATYDDVIVYKLECQKTIKMLKEKKLENKNEAKQKYKLFKALIDVNVYKQPHTLFLDGYTAMEEEHKKYIVAKQILESVGYKTSDQVKTLSVEYSQKLESSNKIDGDIRHFRHEIKMCDKAISYESHIKKQMQKVEQLDEQKEFQKVRDNHEPRW